jgi:hypothetical protein
VAVRPLTDVGRGLSRPGWTGGDDLGRDRAVGVEIDVDRRDATHAARHTHRRRVIRTFRAVDVVCGPPWERLKTDPERGQLGSIDR